MTFECLTLRRHFVEIDILKKTFLNEFFVKKAGILLKNKRGSVDKTPF